jgi:hypothetical protein
MSIHGLRLARCSTVVLVLACELGTAADMRCIKDIELPHYGFVARRNPKGGDVRAIVSIGPNGKAKIVSTPNADQNLATEIRDTLVDGTSYLASCNGEDLEILFTFRLEGKPAVYPFTSVHFEPPNHFIVISEPKKPYVVLERSLTK